MDDWKAKIEGWQTRLAQWQAKFDTEYAALARKRKGLFGKLSDEARDEVAAQARKAAGEEVAVELFTFLAELCDAYRAEPLPAQRAKIRAWIGNQPTTLNATWSFAEQAAVLARGEHGARMLERALAALSIVDLRTDFLALQDLTGRCWVAARKLGLDARAQFAEAARISNQGMGGGGAYMAKLLRDFEGSAYFRDHVRPALPRASA